MLTILHGDDFSASRKALPVGPKTTLDASKLNAEDLVQALQSGNLFGDQPVIILENLFSLRSKTTYEQLLNILQQNADKNIILWHKSKINGNKLRWVKKIKGEIKEFALKKQLFNFLDQVYPQNPQAIILLHQAVKNDPVELIFFFLGRRVSQLIQLKDNYPIRQAPWQLAKLKSQAQKFKLEQLIGIHSALAEIDFSLKSGQDDLPLLAQLDLLVANL